MSIRVLGISAFYHDAAAALVEDGGIVAAAEEERFTRIKHDPSFPIHAINCCLEAGGIDVGALDAIVYYDDPILTWDRVVKSSIAVGEPSRARFAEAARSVLGTKVRVSSIAERALGGLGRAGSLLVTEHHLAHAASAFYPSPFGRAAILTMDGVGEWATTTIGLGEDTRVELLQTIDYPHSLGLLYSAFTDFCGFEVNDGEYKLMGLAPYGRPRYAQLILDELVSLRPDGSFRLDTGAFTFLTDPRMTGLRFEDLFGGPRRVPGERITRRHMDLAASVQAVVEEAVLRIARHARAQTGARRLVMAGGVALNCVANGKLLAAGIFDDLWIQPAAGDGGGALGAALAASHAYFGVPRRRPSTAADGQHGSRLGPAFDDAQIRAFLDRHGLPYHFVPDTDERAASIARALAEGRVVGHFEGRMEFGPRALGARSILADARDPHMQSLVNLEIKNRESFRPFAPAVLRERVGEYFELHRDSPYMLLVSRVRPERHRPPPPVAPPPDDLAAIVSIPRSDLPAVTHVDHSARIQTVGPEDAPALRSVLLAFEALTGCGVLLNTSFNGRDEPIVCSPAHAYACFARTGMDLLVMGAFMVWKSEQPARSTPGAAESPSELLEALALFQRLEAELPPRDERPTPEELEREIDRLFDETVLRFHRARAEPLVPLGPDPDLPSYYRRVVRSAPPVREVSHVDAEGLASALEALWSQPSPVDLAETVPAHARLSTLLSRTAPIPTTTVPTTGYVMV